MLQRGCSILELINKETNQPHLLRFVDDDLPDQYFIAVEQVQYMEVCEVVRGLFILLALHYVFDMEYHPRLRELYLFFEDKILSISTPSCKESATYCNVTSAIEMYIRDP